MDVRVANALMAIRFVLILFMILNVAYASEVTKHYKAKNYRAVSDYYRDHKKENYSKAELAVISYSLRKLGFYRQDIKLNIRLVNKLYKKQHEKLLLAIKRGDTVDSDDYPKALPVLYWNIFSSYGAIIKGYKQEGKRLDDDQKHFKLFSKILSELEYREGKVDKFNDLVIAHRQYLTDKIYRFKASWSVQYVSFQNESTLTASNGKEASLIVTNRGLCAGGDAGIENHRYHFYVDACFLYGDGNVKNNDTSVIQKYQQSNVPAMGLKFGPGASVIVSSSRSRLGIRVPMVYSTQKLEDPPADGATTFKIKQESPLSIITSMYSRWQFDKFYIQTEFGKYVSKELTFWSLGFGKEF